MVNGLIESPRRILFVEDNPADILMLREGFRAAGTNSELIVAENGPQALDAIHGRAKYAGAPAPDLILIHSSSSGDYGRDVLEQTKADPALRGIPVVLLMSAASGDEIRRIYDMHCNCVIRKPIDLEGYIETAREIASFWLEVARLPGVAQLDR